MKEDIKNIKGLSSDGHLDENSIAACAEWLSSGVEKLDGLLQDHLEKCVQCKQAVLEISELSKLHLSMDEHKKTAKDRFEESCAAKYSPVIKTGRANQFWRVAAVFFALISITALTLVLKPQKDSPLVNNVGQADSADLQSVDKGKEVEHIINDSTSQQKSVDPIHIESVGFNRYAENFIPNATYEALIGAQFRAGGRPEILIPGKDTSLVQGSVLTFKGKNPGQDFLEIQILNNHADTVRTFTKLDSINLEVKLDFDPGLYYWKLLGENELHQVGKFIIKEMDR